MVSIHSIVSKMVVLIALYVQITPTRALTKSNAQLFQTDNYERYTTVVNEINTLKKEAGSKLIISLTTPMSHKKAPLLSHVLQTATQTLCDKAHMKVPDICLSFNDSFVYNAAVRLMSDGQYKLVLDQERIKLFFWKKENENLLSACIAHEIGHIHCGHFDHPKDSCTQELEADLFSARLINSPSTTVQDLCLMKLASSLLDRTHDSSLLEQSIAKEETLSFVRKISCALTSSLPHLQHLSQGSTDLYLDFLVSKSLDTSLKKHPLHGTLMSHSLLKKTYTSLHKACMHPQYFTRIKLDAFDKQCLLIESKSSGTSTHPPLGMRCKHILSASVHP